MAWPTLTIAGGRTHVAHEYQRSGQPGVIYTRCGRVRVGDRLDSVMRQVTCGLCLRGLGMTREQMLAPDAADEQPAETLREELAHERASREHLAAEVVELRAVLASLLSIDESEWMDLSDEECRRMESRVSAIRDRACTVLKASERGNG